MAGYLVHRLLLIPVTLLAILLVNFLILNLAPGDPSTISQGAIQGDGAQDAALGGEFGRDDQYLLFREHYGLTRPILFNLWPSTSREKVERFLDQINSRRKYPTDSDEMNPRAFNEFRIRFGDRARFIMPHLLAIANDSQQPLPRRELATRYFIRGGTQFGFLGPRLSEEQKAHNRKVAQDNHFLREQKMQPNLTELREWYTANRDYYRFEPSFKEKTQAFFLDTRISRYLGRVLTLDFGTLRNDSNRTVISEVAKRLKYSLTLAVLPMLLTFILCQVFGFAMALYQNRWPDITFNFIFLALYAIPIFVVAPFLIQRVALPSTLLPVSGFSSANEVYGQLTSLHRLSDVALHLFLPLIAVMYGTLAIQSRLSRTAVLEVLRQDYVRTARAKGLPPLTILWKHVGRNAAITIVTALAASLGVVLGGSLIVETIFGIDGFGRFFYEAVLNRDYNVVLFSALAGAALTLVGYVAADLAYTVLDPRVSLD